jgi:hypothetical protein
VPGPKILEADETTVETNILCEGAHDVTKATRRAELRRRRGVISLYQSGYSIPAIADHRNLRPQTILRLLKSGGVKVKTTNETGR